MTQAKQVALLGRIPPDVKAALDGDVTLLGAEVLAKMGPQARAAISHGLTSAIGGAGAEVLALLPGLRTIASVGAGTDVFDLADLEARGITLHPTPDVMTEDTAECAVGLVFAVLRNVAANDRFVRRGDWAKGRAPLGRRVSGRRVGVVGLGRIGSRVAEKLSALGCAVSYTGRAPKDVPWTFAADIGALAGSVDVLVLTCAGGEATRGLVNADVLERLGPEGFLVNVSRGSVVDEPALIAALEQGRIAGAALDVFENEPTPDARFLDLPTCVFSPHAAVFTRENRHDLIAEIRRLLGLGH
ncbi:NAD(P)-dependent oxidoreductase [Antarctobacter sp.]|uniref:NAD(P)-dependent oxidoreductase n=1 Tax=Antarctobacter sp. TaxID=1872577 RepID=UPI002B27AA88|nr:NAD(P)-dependent oxidoreductase [Antarctobacter sp.]